MDSGGIRRSVHGPAVVAHGGAGRPEEDAAARDDSQGRQSDAQARKSMVPSPIVDNVRAEAVSVVLEVLEIALHQILFERRVYPASVFARQRRFGVAVQMSRHPSLNDYIFRVLQNFQPWVECGAAEALQLVVVGRDDVIIERLTFEVSFLDDATTCTYGELTERIGAFLTALSTLDVQLPPPRAGVSFTVLMLTHEVDASAGDVAFDARLRAHGARHGWAPVPSHAREECLDSSRASKAEGTLSVPLKSLAAGHLQVQLVALVETRKTVPG